MKVQVIDTISDKRKNALIEEASKKDMPIKKNGWQFTWKILFKTEGATFYKLRLENEDNIEGMLMLSLMNDEMLYMNNIEVSPNNLGSNGRYDNVAGCLIAYACLKSFELGQNYYKGYLTFQSKTQLIPLYESKYGAIQAMGQRMFIEPQVGLQLIKKYLNHSL